MIQIIVQAQKASCRKSSGERITTGMVGKQVSFDFSAEWDGLVKTAVFEGSGVKKDVTLSGDTAVIPHECLTAPGGMLRVGVYGTDGTIQTPTVYTDIGQIEQGADPSGDTSADPTLPIWAQLQAMMGSLDNLTTTAKENLVAAINEAAASGGAGSMSLRVSGDYIQYSTDGGITWQNLIAVADLKGDPGAPGKDGHSPVVTATKSGKTTTISVDGTAIATVEDGADGAPGSRGADGITPTIGSNGNWYLGETDTGKPSRGADGATGATGATGQKGTDGKSAYQYAQVGGYTGTEAEFAVKLAQEKFANPNALTFTGAVTGSYDGSEPLTVEIPSGGSGGSDAWNLIYHFTVADAAINYEIPMQPGAKEYGIYWNYTQPSGNIPKRSIMVDSSLALYGVMYRCTTNETLFLRVFKGPSNILATGQGVGYAAQRFSNGGTNIGSGTDFPAMTLTTDIACATSEIWVYWR